MKARSYLPFRESFREAVISGRKTATTRSEAYGAVGDVLDTPFGSVELTDVRRVPLTLVANGFYAQEGLDSPEAFIAIWNEIHPRRKYRPEDVKTIHFFKFLGPERVGPPGDATSATGNATKILKAVKSTPGKSFSEYARATGIDADTVAYHVDRAAKLGLVVVERRGQGATSRIFPTGYNRALSRGPGAG